MPSGQFHRVDSRSSDLLILRIVLRAEIVCSLWPRQYVCRFVWVYLCWFYQQFLYCLFTLISQGCFTGTGAIICQWSNPEGYGYNWRIVNYDKQWQNMNGVFNSSDVLCTWLVCQHVSSWFLAEELCQVDVPVLLISKIHTIVFSYWWRKTNRPICLVLSLKSIWEIISS